MRETEQGTNTESTGTAVEPRRDDEMGGAPYPSDMTLPDPRAGDRGGDFEGETDPRLQDAGETDPRLRDAEARHVKNGPRKGEA